MPLPDLSDAVGPRSTAPLWVGAVVGLVAAGAGIAVSELVAAISVSMRSPLVSVGDRVIDAVPPTVKDWAISVFGTGDKTALLIGTAVLLACYAAVLGIVAVRRSLTVALAGVGLFALVGALASLGRGGGGWASPVPSIAAGLVAAGVMVLLTRRAIDAWPRDEAGARPILDDSIVSGSMVDDSVVSRPMVDDSVVSMNAMRAGSRRRFLGTAAAIGAAAVVAGGVGRWMADRATVTAERLGIRLPRPAQPLPPVPAGVQVDVAGVSPFITPNEDFYRIDTAIIVPSVTVGDWKLDVKGMVDRPVSITYDQLLARPMIEADVTLSCVSNEVGGDLVGNARWLGCRLDDLLAEVGVDPRADQIVGRSVDGFTAGFPTSILDGRDALVAVGMNGEVLPVEHGFPARLVIPGLYGYVSATKWLSEIELTRFDEFEGYWIPRGWSADGPIKTQSRIDVPKSGARVEPGKPLAIGGVAWSPVKGITKVEVQVDDGPWEEATLGEEFTATSWRLWQHEITPAGGRQRVRVRATDGTGQTQTADEAPPEPDGATGWHDVRIEGG